MPFTIVCKPQVPFSQRLKDPNLRRLTVAQLPKQVRVNGLNVSRLTEKWEFVHVLVQARHSVVQEYVENVQDNKRRTIVDLPGEIRNKIYSYVLVDENLVVVIYRKHNTMFLLSHLTRTRLEHPLALNIH